VIKPRSLPRLRVQLPFERSFTEAEFSCLKQGFAAESMEDRWHIFFNHPWLTFAQLDWVLYLQSSAGRQGQGMQDC
jgi:hypothetical protein